MTKPEAVKVDVRGLPLGITHPDKVFWPDEGYTKLDLANYYDQVFPHLVPYVTDRLLTLARCPDGMRGECFYQREAPRGMPAGIPTKPIRGRPGPPHCAAGGGREDPAVGAHIAARRGRAYLDPFRNGFAQRVVGPFSVRRRPEAPISTPLHSSEVSPALVPSNFNLGTFAKRLAEPDPWKEFFRKRQSLGPAMKAVQEDND